MAKNKQITSYLQRAKALIEKYGWRKTHAKTGTAVDLISAFKKVTYNDCFLYSHCYEAFRKANKVDGLLSDWNDKQESISTILEAFDRAIEVR